MMVRFVTALCAILLGSFTGVIANQSTVINGADLVFWFSIFTLIGAIFWPAFKQILSRLVSGLVSDDPDPEALSKLDRRDGLGSRTN